MFPAFVENPKNYRFQGQDDDEDILLLVRAHPITNLAWIIPAVIIFFIPFLLPPIIIALGFGALLNLPSTYLSAFIIINYLLVLIISFEGFLNWYFNVNLVTTKEVLDIDFNSILFKNVDFAPLEDVQEANSTIAGLLGTLFNFGTVLVETAGERVEIDFTNVPRPDKIADLIIDQSQIAKRQ